MPKNGRSIPVPSIHVVRGGGASFLLPPELFIFLYWFTIIKKICCPASKRKPYTLDRKLPKNLTVTYILGKFCRVNQAMTSRVILVLWCDCFYYGGGERAFFSLSTKTSRFFASKFSVSLISGLLHKKSKNHPKGYFYFFEKRLWNICLCDVFFILPDHCKGQGKRLEGYI